jgi:hypothetical protein
MSGSVCSRCAASAHPMARRLAGGATAAGSRAAALLATDVTASCGLEIRTPSSRKRAHVQDGVLCKDRYSEGPCHAAGKEVVRVFC